MKSANVFDLMKDAAQAMGRHLLYLTSEKLGAKQSLTPEGFLLCEEVPFATTEDLLYGPDETPIAIGPNGYVRVHRDEKDVFDPEFMASFNLKPVVNGHPVDPKSGEFTHVDPDNFKDFTVGTVSNPRRGTGALAHALVVDMLIMDAQAIDEVRRGKRQVSAGYRADYEEIQPGEGRQINLRLGNHIALVPSGRCGPECSIRDHDSLSNGGSKMKTFDTGERVSVRVKKVWDGMRAAVLAAMDKGDKDEVKRLLDAGVVVADEDPAAAGGPGAVNLHMGGRDDKAHERLDAHDTAMKALTDRLDAHDAALEEIRGLNQITDENAEAAEQMAEEAPAEEKEQAANAQDSSYLARAYQDAVAGCDILAPGMSIPFTFDQKAKPAKTFDCICKLRRSALELAGNRPETKLLVEQINGGKPLVLDGMSCADVRTKFNAAVAATKAVNSARAADRGQNQQNRTPVPMRDPASINAQNRNYWAGRTGAK